MWDNEYILPSFLFVPVEKHKTAFDGKVMAIYVALEQIVPRYLYNKVVILSDFKAAIQAVGTGLSYTASIAILTVISVERYVAIVHPMLRNHQMARIVRRNDESVRERYIRNGGKEVKLFTSALKAFQCNNRIVMVQRKYLDDFFRGRIIERLEWGRSQLEVSEELEIAQSVISRLWQ
ncbi:HTH_Tnp_Tc3_2 domain-containing protein [Trichonephila clavipes]|nr:HTH_Tnp_Tc3_2 domain-containing protein [Trichonephila clavipes]